MRKKRNQTPKKESTLWPNGNNRSNFIRCHMFGGSIFSAPCCGGARFRGANKSFTFKSLMLHSSPLSSSWIILNFFTSIIIVVSMRLSIFCCRYSKSIFKHSCSCSFVVFVFFSSAKHMTIACIQYVSSKDAIITFSAPLSLRLMWPLTH